jgi:hypothetical protein
VGVQALADQLFKIGQEKVSLRPNRRSRRRARFWTRLGDATPAEAEEVRNRIESKAKAYEYRELNLRALRGHDDVLFEAISRCTAHDPCAEILCSFCARRYRLWLGSELVHLTAHGPPAFVATILLQAAQGSALSEIEPRILHERVRKRLTRAGISAAIGGTEASYRAKEDRWIVHLHLLVFGTLGTTAVRLREIFRDPDLDRAVVCQPLHSRAAQISYLQKFQTCHRPGEAGFSGRGKAYPMKREQIAQLAQWTRRFWFEDFLFVLGLRRRGERFDPENGFRQALGEAQRNTRVRGDGGDGGDGLKRHVRSASPSPPPRTSSVTVLHTPTTIPINCTAIQGLNAQFAKTRTERRRRQFLELDLPPSPPRRDVAQFVLASSNCSTWPALSKSFSSHDI